MAVYKEEKTNTWRAVYRYTDWNGERKQTQKRGFKTKREAQAWEREQLNKASADLDMTFKSFVDLYTADMKTRLKENTWSTKEHIIRTKLLPYFGKLKMCKITAQQIITWQNEMMNHKDEQGKPYSPVYLKTVHNQLSAIFNHAVRYYNLRENPCKKAGSMGKKKNREMLFWTKEEYLKFAEAMMDKPLSFYAFEMLYWCGIREGELLALTPADFDFEKGTVSINKSYQRLNGQDLITTPKTEKSNRVITMPQFLANEIQDYLALEDDFQRIQNRMFMMYGVNDTPNLHFATAAGKIGNGLDEQLENFMREHPDTNLIIIDTMQKIREVGGEAYSYASDYEIVGKLKQLADKHCICVLTVHHTRKQPAGDAFEMISGTTGLLGCADGSLLMQKKKRTALEATIDVVGRDQQDQILYLKKDPETQIWNLERMETEPHKEPPDPVLEAVAKLVSAERQEWTGSPSELAATVQVGMAANALTKYLNVKSGRLLEEYHVGYENRARHAGRQVKLTYMLVEAPAFEVVEDGRDGSDGCNGENATTQTTVAIVAAVAERNGSE